MEWLEKTVKQKKDWMGRVRMCLEVLPMSTIILLYTGSKTGNRKWKS